MSNTVISVENLSKAYRIGLKDEVPDTFVGALQSWVKAPVSNFKKLRRLDTYSANGNGDDILWALNDVSFEVKEGEVVGIVGSNGAGKSTLLKILSQVTEPTSGRAVLHGRVSSLLEVGTGFHPEMTGRENVYLNGTILGMTKREIDNKFDEIVEFSEVERFLDTPVKRYSSGMKVRLAFAVAAHLDPEILIVDEVLAVGDVAFQSKCLQHMDKLRKSGMTIVLVSHQIPTIKRICPRVMYFSQGELRFDGDSATGISKYQSTETSNGHSDAGNEEASEKDSPIFIKGLSWESEGKSNADVRVGAPVNFTLKYEAKEAVESPVFHVSIRSSDHQVYFGASTAYDNYETPTILPGEGEISLSYQYFGLEPAIYDIAVGIWTKDAFSPYYWNTDYAKLSVVGERTLIGRFELEHSWSSSKAF